MKIKNKNHLNVEESVIAVPPLAINDNGKFNFIENEKIIKRLHEGGVTSFLYGGNANFYNIRLSEYEDIISSLINLTPKDSWLIPSIGPDFGKALDQSEILKNYEFPTVMLLPLSSPTDPNGVAIGIRKLSEIAQCPLIVYLKEEKYLTIPLLAELLDDGVIFSVKYAIERSDPANDIFLDKLIDEIGASHLISGFGELPVKQHVGEKGMKSYTSGSVCIVPRLSMEYFKLIKNKKFKEAEKIKELFKPLEYLRNEYSPIRVLHQAVSLAGIANTGSLSPFLSSLKDVELLKKIEQEAKALLHQNVLDGAMK